MVEDAAMMPILAKYTDNNTPHPSTGNSPSDLKGRRLETKISANILKNLYQWGGQGELTMRQERKIVYEYNTQEQEKNQGTRYRLNN